MTKQQLLDKLLWQGQAKTNLIFAGIGFGIGLFMLLASCHLYFSLYRPIKESLENAQNSEFLVINKQVKLSNTFSFNSTDFSEKEIEDLKSQDFVKDIGSFETNRFRITGVLGGEIRVQTDLFFESVEDRFLDEIPENWSWKEGDSTLPVIISNDFLNLYNFGFAGSQNLPQLSRQMVTQVPLYLTIRGNGKRLNLTAIVGGFSDRYVSVLVPRSFVDWANTQFADEPMGKPSRMVIKVEDPSDKRIRDYLEENGLETNKDKLKTSARSLVSILLYILTGLGILFTALSLMIFILFFQLIISRSNREIRLLVELGYYVGQIRKTLLRHFGLMTIIIYMLVYMALWLAIKFAASFLAGKGYEIQESLHPSVYFGGLLLLLIIFAINFKAMSTNIKRLFSQEQ